MHQFLGVGINKNYLRRKLTDRINTPTLSSPKRDRHPGQEHDAVQDSALQLQSRFDVDVSSFAVTGSIILREETERQVPDDFGKQVGGEYDND